MSPTDKPVGTKEMQPVPISSPPTADTPAGAVKPAGTTNERPTNALAGIRILAVDDNPINRAVLAKLCKPLGLEAEILAGPREFIDRVEAMLAAREAAPHAFLIDINMPGMDGLAALRCVRLLGGWAARVPALAFTAHAIEGAAQNFLQNGMQGYIAKPIDQRNFVSELERVLGEDKPG